MIIKIIQRFYKINIIRNLQKTCGEILYYFLIICNLFIVIQKMELFLFQYELVVI